MGKTYYSPKEEEDFPSTKNFNMYTSAEILEMNNSIFDEIPTEIEYQEISSTSFQRVVWGMKEIPEITIVKMKVNNIIDHHISKGHQRRPFIIIRDNKFRRTVQGFYLTSNLHNCSFRTEKNKRYKKTISHENLTKTSLICHDNFVELPYNHVLHDIGELKNKKDINQLIKVNALLKRYLIYSDGKKDMIEVGDIVKVEDKFYIIHQLDNSFAYLVCIEKVEDTNVDVENDSRYFHLYNHVYQIFHEECIRLPLNYNLLIVGILLYKELKVLFQKRYQYFYEKKYKKGKSLYLSSCPRSYT